MTRKITIPDTNSKNNNVTLEQNKITNIPPKSFLELLKERYPDKLNFNIAETACILNLSYNFVRDSILRGSIQAIKYGDRYMINLFEIARILNEGVENGN